MSDSAIAILAVAGVVLVALFLLRNQVRRLVIKAGTDGVEADLETHETRTTGKPASVRIVGNKLIGKRNRIDVERGDVEVADNVQDGKDHGIRARSEQGTGHKRR